MRSFILNHNDEFLNKILEYVLIKNSIKKETLYDLLIKHKIISKHYSKQIRLQTFDYENILRLLIKSKSWKLIADIYIDKEKYEIL